MRRKSDRNPGDDPLGLLGAFIVAGVGNIIGGLWPVEDRAARLFAFDFYKNVSVNDLASAFRLAAVSAIKAGRRTADWADFQLVGSGRARF